MDISEWARASTAEEFLIIRWHSDCYSDLIAYKENNVPFDCLSIATLPLSFWDCIIPVIRELTFHSSIPNLNAGHY